MILKTTIKPSAKKPLPSIPKQQPKYIKLSGFEDKAYPVTFILGARGVGKTTAIFIENIPRCLKAGTQFIYLRRYQSEVDTLGLKLGLISKLTGHVVTRETFKLENGRPVDAIMVDDVPVAFLLALNTVGKIKSSDFESVDWIYYDEFLDLKNRELKNETFLYLQFAMTVFRDFRKYRATFCANATNIYNCYFIDFEIFPKARVTKFKDTGFKIVMYQTSEALDEERAQTALAKQVEIFEGKNGSSLHNKFANQFDDFIRKLTKDSRQEFTMVLDGDYYGVWKTPYGHVISKRYNADTKKMYAMRRADVRENRPLISYDYFVQMQGLFEQSSLFYSDVKTRSVLIRYFKDGRYTE